MERKSTSRNAADYETKLIELLRSESTRSWFIDSVVWPIKAAPATSLVAVAPANSTVQGDAKTTDATGEATTVNATPTAVMLNQKARSVQTIRSQMTLVGSPSVNVIRWFISSVEQRLLAIYSLYGIGY